MQQFVSQDWRAGRIREWLLLLLRFAITCDPKDQAAAFAMADEIDARAGVAAIGAEFLSPHKRRSLRGDHRTRGSEANNHSRKAHRTDRRSTIAASLSRCSRA